jgi:hypothetical protein
VYTFCLYAITERRRRWQDNIKPHLTEIWRRCDYDIARIFDLTEIGWEIVHWIHLHLHSDQWWAVVNRVMNLSVSRKADNFLTSSIRRFLHQLCALFYESVLCGSLLPWHDTSSGCGW